MKKIVIFLVALISFFVISCDKGHIEPRMPDTEILSVLISANSVSITWEDVGTKSKPCYYSVSVYKVENQNCWNDGEDYYYVRKLMDDKSYYSANGYVCGGYPSDALVDSIDETYETSALFNNLESSTIYGIDVEVHGNAMSGGSGGVFFRTKEE
jgi:hypothetical protein